MNALQKNKVVDMIYGKIPPQARDMEEAVLGAIMIEKEAFDEVAEILKPECFYVESNERIFRAIQLLAQRNMPTDLLNVVEQLKSVGELDMVGGAYYVTRLTNSIQSSANIISHARIIFQKFLARQLIKLSGELTAVAYEDSTDIFELIDYAETSINDIGIKNISGGMISMDNVMVKTLKKIEEWRKIEGVITGIPTGFYDLDRALRGLQPGDLILLGARPSAGKTAFALQVARFASKTTAVAIWSLEMKAVYLALRMLSTESKTNLYKIQTGSLSDEEMAGLYNNAAKKLASLNIFFDESTKINIHSIKRKARMLKKKKNLGLILIDYVQLMSGDDNKVNREREIATISRELKNLASELDIPIIALSQLSRTEGAKNISWDYGPPPNALRESGALEQDADVIMMLWGPGDEDIKKDPSLAGKRKIRIVKQRNGVLITEELEFRNEIQFFEAVQKMPGYVSVSHANEKFKDQQLFDDKEEIPF